MAYTQNEKSTGLDVLTSLASGDLHIVGDVSDSGRAKAITEANLELTIANSNNFITALTTQLNDTVTVAVDGVTITGDGTTGNPLVATAAAYSLDVQENGVSVETPVDTINFVAPSGTVTTPSAGVVDIDLSSLIGGSGGGGTKLAIDTNEVTTSSVTPVAAFTIPIPANTLGTNDAIRFKTILTTGANAADVRFDVTYGGQYLAQNVQIVGQSVDFEVSGIIIADNSASAQKAQVTYTDINGGDDEYNVINSALTVTSTTNQDLIFYVYVDNVAQSVTAEAIVVERITDGGLQTKTVVLSNTDINGMYASPYTLVAAPGAGKVNVVESVLFYFDYGTVQYTGGGSVSIIEETSGTALTTGFSDTFITAASNAIIQRNALAPVSTSLTENKAIQLTNATGAFSAGDGTLKVVLNYRVITL